ncbi:MAG: murein biosynthesis integral membrane protein MurJ [Thermoleophilia bacterium]|nr:murein biosynthesis integral membrane protein MurJ [Thermoleophilia bacterium]
MEDPPTDNAPIGPDAEIGLDLPNDDNPADESGRRDPTADAEAAAIEHASAERQRMSLAALVFGVATFISRIAGTAREIVTAALFGVGTQLSAFTIAFQIPNLIRALVADSALSGAFVPVFTELREKGETERAWRLAGTFITIIFMVLGPLSLLCALFAPQVVSLFVAEGKLGTDGFDLAVTLMRIMLPIVVIFALNGLVVGILNANDRFAAAALAPIAWNMVILASLATGLALVPRDNVIYFYALGVVVGTLAQFVIPLPQLRGLGGTLRPHANLRDPRVRQVLVLMLPVTISLGLINLQQLIDTLISTHVADSWFRNAGVSVNAGPSILDKAFRLYMLPQGIFSVGISTVIFPVLARLAARGDDVGFREHFSRGMRQILLTLIPSTVFLLVFAEPAVQVLYQHGKFTHPQTLVVADALRGFAVGLALNGATLLAIRAFFARKLTYIPSLVSVLTLVANIALDLALYRPFGVTGIALATSLVNVIGFGTMYLLLRRRIGLLGTTRTLGVTGKAIVASVAAGVVSWLGFQAVEAIAPSSVTESVVVFAALTAATVIFVAIYLVGIVVTRLVTADELRSTLRRRRRRGK